MSRRCTHSPLVRDIAAAAFTDNGAMIQHADIEAALTADLVAGFRHPTAAEVMLLVGGDDSGQPPFALCAAHPALDALLTREMT